MRLIHACLICLCGSLSAAPMQVSALHPLLADLARQVGGDRILVADLMGDAGNLHRFEPRPADLKQMQASAIVLASGKNLEPYLKRLIPALNGVSVIDVGKTIPSLTAKPGAPDSCCPADATGHDHGADSLDPHWWQSIDHMRRAARIVAVAFADKDPAGKEYFMNRAMAYGQRLEALKHWAIMALDQVPPGQRKLVTAHNAFAYFAKEFGFEVIAVAGLNKEQNNTPKDLAATIDAVKNSGVRAVFPETNTNGKVLDSIVAATGTRLAQPLIADGNGRGIDAGFEAMIRHNVNAITQALTPP